MVSVAISSGHGKYIRGARGNPVPPQLDEVDQARRVVDRVAELWNANGVSAKKFHDNTSTSQSQNLSTITNWHNAQSRDYDISVHFNAYKNTANPMGVEVLYVNNNYQTMAADLSRAIAQAATFINRGAKRRTDLAFLNNTTKPALLIETCFCDSTADSNLYNQHFERICTRIAEVIGKITIGAPPTEPPVEPETPPPDAVTARVDITIKTEGNVIVTINGEDFMVSTPGPEEPEPIPEFPPNHQNITCTVFGGKSDPNDSAYPPYDTITDSEVSCALPYSFTGTRPPVWVHNVDTGLDVICQIRDKGPWLIDDTEYVIGDLRPWVETCYMNQTPLPRGPNKGKVPTNDAALDLTPGAAKAIKLSGKGKVHWRFIEPGETIA